MITNLALVKQELLQNIPNQNRPSSYDESAIRRALPRVLQRIETHCRREFAPRLATRTFSAKTIKNGGTLDGATLYLHQHIMSISALVVDETTLDLANVELVPGNDESAGAICLTDGSTWRAYVGNYNQPQPISISGIWGYHQHISEAWVNSGEAVAAGGLSSGTTTITVSDASADNAQFFAPRLSPGMLLKINDEFMLVSAIADGNTEISVIRGVNGTTPAAHLEGDTLYTFAPDYAIEGAATRWVAFAYKRLGVFETSRVEGMAEIRFPKDIPGDVESDLRPFVRLPLEQVRGLGE